MFRPRCINEVATTNTAIMQFSTIFWPENTAVLSNAQLCGIQPDPQEMVDVFETTGAIHHTSSKVTIFFIELLGGEGFV